MTLLLFLLTLYEIKLQNDSDVQIVEIAILQKKLEDLQQANLLLYIEVLNAESYRTISEKARALGYGEGQYILLK